MQSTLQISYSLSNIKDASHQFWQYAHQYRIFAFSGEMGAGKTTFIHTLCEQLGVQDNVSSPTFALINEYRTPSKAGNKEQVIYHMDWYRLKDDEEAIQAGMEDCLKQKNAICLVEWPEKALALLPKPYLWIAIEVLSESERQMSVTIHE